MLIGFAALTIAVSDQQLLVGETALLEAVNDLPAAIGWPLRVAMQLGTLWVALAVAAAVAVWERLGGPRAALPVALAAIVAFRLDNLIKDVIDRPRPAGLVDGLHLRETIGGFGYPSGHATMAFAVAAALHPAVPARWRWAPWTVAAGAAAARMHVGVHWPADVVGGAALGTAVGAAAVLAGLVLGAAATARRRGRLGGR